MANQNQPQDPYQGPPRGHQPPPPPGFGPPQQPPTQAYPQGAPSGHQAPPTGYGYGQPQPPQQPYAGGNPAYGQAPNTAQMAGPQAPGAAPGKGRGGKALAIGLSAALAVGLIGGGTVFAFSKLSGGGAQPEEALPASTVAFMKVDLDPSAGQKVDGFRFARKFPELRQKLEGVDEKGDLREEVFKAIQRDGEASDLDYDKDIKPWLGDRMAVAAVKDGDAAIPVFALAITDQDKAKEGLDKIRKSGNGDTNSGYCSVQPDFAICGDDQAKVDTVVEEAKKGSLADSENFSQDMKTLGEDGIASAWFDVGEAQALTGPGSLFGPGAGSSPFPPATPDPYSTTQSNYASNASLGANAPTQAKGRAAMALRFDGPTLELAVMTSGTGQKWEAKTGTTLGDLPADTAGAVSINGMGKMLTDNWGSIEQQLDSTLGTTWRTNLQQFESDSGLSVPGDLAKMLGDDLTVAVGPQQTAGGEAMLAVRTNGDRGLIDKTIGSSANQPGGAFIADGKDNWVVLSNDNGYATAVGQGGELGKSEAFKKAMPDVDKAQAAGYLNLETLVGTFSSQLSESERATLEPLSSLGFTAWSDGDVGHMRLRLATK